MSSFAEVAEPPESIEDSTWLFPTRSEDAIRFRNLRTWDRFYDQSFLEPRTAYISEQPTQIFDSVLALQAGDSGRILQSQAVLAALLHLGLGRESFLYYYNEEQRTFRPRVEDGRSSGYSLDTFSHFTSTLIQQGNSMKTLRQSLPKTQMVGESFPALVAFGGELSEILSVLEAQVLNASSKIASLLQLETIFKGTRQTVACLQDMISMTERTKTDEDLVSQILKMVAEAEHGPASLRWVFFKILESASRPWQESIGGWTGLRHGISVQFEARLPPFVTLNGKMKRDADLNATTEQEYEFAPSGMPSFISEEDSQLIFETGRALRLLENHLPDHPLTTYAGSSSPEAPELEWQFTWHDIERVSIRAKEYEDNLRQAIERYHMHGRVKAETETTKKKVHSTHASSTMSAQERREWLHRSIATIERPLDGKLFLLEDDAAQSIMDEAAEADVFPPPVSLLASLSFQPFVAAQSRLVNQACLRLLFKDFDIRAHFSLLYRYSLLGDGVFSSRLSHALFNPDLESAERRKGHSRLGTTGLKLGYRDRWPPASSELRLALMGILTDSYFPAGYTARPSLFREDLPGGLSFAIRDMSEGELQRCVDPNSIYALDFLRLQYRAPPPLNAVITATSLNKYDAIFKLLLRAKRMLFVVDQLSRDLAKRASFKTPRDIRCQRFRIEGHHFVSTVCTYFFDGVTEPWGVLRRRMNGVVEDMDKVRTGSGESVSKLRDFHDHLLDRMMFTLLLRKRQGEVMKLLEEIFGLILRFANYVRTADRGLLEYDLAELYDAFRKKVRIFVTVCRGLSERRGHGGTSSVGSGCEVWTQSNANEDGDSTMGQLLLKFELSGFYAH